MIRISKKDMRGARVTVTVCENATPGTWGSHQLLLDEYHSQDMRVRSPRFGPGNPEYDQMEFNTNWLKSMEAKYGSLRCEYCGKPLKIFEWWQKPDVETIATTDHFFPKASRPDLAREVKNFVVSCHHHNNRKKAKIISKSAIKFPYPEERIF
jgi:hypothetical protein